MNPWGLESASTLWKVYASCLGQLLECIPSEPTETCWFQLHPYESVYFGLWHPQLSHFQLSRWMTSYHEPCCFLWDWFAGRHASERSQSFDYFGLIFHLLKFNHFKIHTSDPNWHAKIDELHQQMDIHDSLLLQTDNVHILFRILSGMQLLSIVQQIIKLPTINFVKRNPNRNVSILIL